MLSRFRPSAAMVVACVALFVALGGGAYALSGSNTVQSDDLGPGAQVKAADLAGNSVSSSKVVNGSLNDEDVGEATFVNFAANIGMVHANDCNLDQITGVNAQGDHMLLTPSASDRTTFLEYSIAYLPDAEFAQLQTCNNSNQNFDDGITHFNLLIFDAQ